MTIERFHFQRACVARTTGTVINVGCNLDPAHLKETYGGRVWNCDDREYDPVLEQPIPADLVFDCGEAPWPFFDNEAELVVLGDILEHLTSKQQLMCLCEARRVAPKVCITVPNDDRFLHDPAHDPRQAHPGASVHITHVTMLSLRELLEMTGWRVTTWKTVDYTFVPEGYFVEAERTETPPREIAS